MGHDHSHAPAPGATVSAGYRRRLMLVLAITVTVLVIQIIGALISGSLALLADAGHMATDSLGVVLALVAVTLAQRAASTRRTFGWQRVEVLAALGNSLLLLGIGIYIVVQAIQRIGDPPEIRSGVMLAAAVLGLVANLASLAILRAGQDKSLNMRGAYLEVLGDALGSFAVIVAAILIITTGWTGADIVASLVVGALVLPRAWSLLRDALDVLLENAPRDVDMTQVRQHILNTQDVLDVHDLHAWTITSGSKALSAHVVVEEAALADGHGGRVLDSLGECLGEHFDMEHCTFQLESATHRAHEAPVHD
ncbi:cobalt-zinc-cadmium efflux system protein [Klenkia marina]|uniref:Cobalt-zinc-cadmium efflux system protein n=2 Tax=Klenkia marina TaxID=1960309 RepID=A0A1G4Z4U5_9ACTN|nr:cobalt-zinc-cadmium efflux system protein [Klenkia marina]